jgi:hypothetical protein
MYLSYYVEVETYEGMHDGTRSGYGNWTSKGDNTYKGEWENVEKNGLEEYSEKEGFKYVGNWENNKINGKGTNYWPSGNTWQGTFLDD